MSKTLSDQPALLQAILDTSIAAICVLDPQGQIIFANAKAEDILGLKPQEIVKRTYDAPEWKSTAIDGGPWPDENQPFSRVMRTGEPVFDIQHAIEWPDGRRKLLSINGAPIKNERGEITSLVFLVTDITERARIDRRMTENAAWLGMALESAQMGIWSWNVKSGEVRWSDEVGPLFGLASGEFGGKYEDYLQLIHPDDREKVEATIESSLRSESAAYEIEHRLLWPDGEIHWIEAFGRVVRDESGTPIQMTGTVADITGRKSAETALRQSEELVRSVLETVPTYIVSVAPDHTIRFLNRTLPHLNAEDVIGEDIVQFMAEESRPAYREALERAFATGEPQELEGLALQGEGDPAPFLLRLGPVKSGDEVTSLTAAGLDISGLKDAEKALRDSQEQLRQSQRLESVGRLAGGIAHDFNNLLTAIVGCSDLLQSRISDWPEGLEFVKDIRDAAGRGADLTRQLLTFAHQRVVRPQVVNLNRRIADINQMLPRLIGENIALATELEPDLWPVEVDPGQLEQVMVNLAVNARDAMPDGGRLTITTANSEIDEHPVLRERGLEGREWVVMTVTDTGVGMNAETLRLAFEPFYTTKQSGKGSGLGLATCFGIVRQAGGHIEAESEPGRGTCFRVYLPKSHKQPEPEAASRQKARPVAGRETILLVEDESSVRRIVATLLQDAGYRLLEAGGGDEALKLFESHDGDIDLLITDVVMPGMSGTDLASELLRRRPDLKVLLMSGYSPDYGSLGELAGKGVELMQKPFSRDRLSDKIRELLEADGTKISADERSLSLS